MPYNGQTFGGIIGFISSGGSTRATWDSAGNCDSYSGSTGTGNCTADHDPGAGTLSP